MEFLADFLIPVIMGICLSVGYIVKRWIKDVDNKYIPTLCAAVGLVVAVWINWGNVTPEVILCGLMSGLASTGLHQAFTQMLNKDNEERGFDSDDEQ